MKHSVANELASHRGLHHAIAWGTLLSRGVDQYEAVREMVAQRYQTLMDTPLSDDHFDYGIAVLIRRSTKPEELAKASKMGRAITCLRATGLKTRREIVEHIKKAGGMEKLIRSTKSVGERKSQEKPKDELKDLIVTLTPEQLREVLACEGGNVAVRLSVGLLDEAIGLRPVELLDVEPEVGDEEGDAEDEEGDTVEEFEFDGDADDFGSDTSDGEQE